MPKFDILCKNCDAVLGSQESDSHQPLDIVCVDCAPHYVNPGHGDNSTFQARKDTAVAAAVAAYTAEFGKAPKALRA